jgi:hypothetical protein
VTTADSGVDPGVHVLSSHPFREPPLTRPFCGPRWNRTTDLSIIWASSAGHASGMPSDVPFVPRRANQRQVVPLRLGTARFRHHCTGPCLSVPRTYATANRLALLAWATAEAPRPSRKQNTHERQSA